MKPEIIARGWFWDISQKETAWIAYKCHGCGFIKTFPAPRRIGVKCDKCNNMMLYYSYVRRVREVK